MRLKCSNYLDFELKIRKVKINNLFKKKKLKSLFPQKNFNIQNSHLNNSTITKIKNSQYLTMNSQVYNRLYNI